MSASDTVERFLATGEHDPRFPGFPGNAVERRRRGAAALREVLCKVIGWRTNHAPLARRSPPKDAAARVQARVAPLVRGMFAPDEAGVLLEALPTRVVVVTPATFAPLCEDVPLRVAWDLANLLLDDLGAPPLADDTPSLDGLCAGGRAWVLPRAFSAADGTFPDVIVHEVAHLLHSVRCADVGLPTSGWLLRVPPRRRETFAYGCEMWSACCREPDAFAHVAQLLTDSPPDDARVDPDALICLLRRASAAEGGWRVLRTWAEGSEARRGTSRHLGAG